MVFWRVFKRSIVRIVTREELWAGNRESFYKTFFTKESIILWSMNTYALRKKRIGEAIAAPEFRHLGSHRLRTPKEASEFLAFLRM